MFRVEKNGEIIQTGFSTQIEASNFVFGQCPNIVQTNPFHFIDQCDMSEYVIIDEVPW